jgi:hypothetical protein
MLTGFWILEGIIILFLVAVLWALYCNNKTYNERMALLDIAFNKNISDVEHSLRIEAYRKVTYEQHLWAKIFFRDWKRLYENDIAYLIR